MMPLRGYGLVTVALVVVGLLVGGLLLPAGVFAEAPKATDSLGFEYAFILGASSGPFSTDPGVYIGASLGVPLFKADPLFGQKLLGEILVGASKTDDDLNNVAPVAAGQTAKELNITTVQIVPGLKYKFDLGPVQPYVVAGIGMNIFLSKTQPGDVVGGIAPLPRELKRRGVAAGQGDARIGANIGLGVDLSLHKNIFVGAEFRHNAVGGRGDDFQTYGGKVGFRF